ncbi:MAG: T9SS type A sorting domain-containing protein [Flavobacteriales bacterium]
MKHLLFCFLIIATVSVRAQSEILWSENFDDTTTLPSGFNQETFADDGGWLVNSTASLSSTYFSIPIDTGYVAATNDDDCNCDKSNDFLHTPILDLSTAANPHFVFDAFFLGHTFAGSTESLEVLASEDAGANWSTLIFVEGASQWQTLSIDLSGLLATNVMIGFRYDDGGDWLFGAAIDYLQLIDLDETEVAASISNASLAIAVEDIPTYVSGFTKYITGEDVFASVEVSNTSLVPISSLDFICEFGGNTLNESFENLNLHYGESTHLVFTNSLVMPAGVDTLHCTLSAINGLATSATTITPTSGITINPNKKVVIEQLISTGNGWSPRGYVFADYLSEKYPDNVVALNVHTDDPMANDEYETALVNQLSAYPMGLVDRADYSNEAEVNPMDYEKAVIERLTDDSGVEIEVYIDLLSNVTATVICHVHFNAPLSGTYKVATMLVEDEVSGSGNGWNQANMFADNAYGPMAGYETLPITVSASAMEYNQVGRLMAGSWSGSDDASFSSPIAGLTDTLSFGVTMDASWNLENVIAVVMLINSLTGDIVNAGTSELFSVGVTELEPASSIKIYPNPADDIVYIKLNMMNATPLTISVSDLTGRQVMSMTVPTANVDNIVSVNTIGWPSGLYMLQTLVDGQVSTLPLLVN